MKKQKTKYNNSLYISTCAICQEPVDDIHHIKNQKDADSNGLIDNSFHKNHKYNLIS
jgi:DNA mismatch repair protein MutS